MKVVVIGIGNPDRGDDGAGPAVTALLRQRLPAAQSVSVVDSDGDPARLIDAWDGAGLAVVIDAVHSHAAPPGHVHRVTVDAAADPAAAFAAGGPSTHGLGPGDAIALAAALDRLPGSLAVFGIEGDQFGFGDDLSAAVARSVLQVADEVAALVTTTPDKDQETAPCA